MTSSFKKSRRESNLKKKKTFKNFDSGEGGGKGKRVNHPRHYVKRTKKWGFRIKKNMKRH